MCMNCGCGLPDERHGHPENITADDLRRAGAVNGQSLRESAEHILATVDVVEGSSGESGRTGSEGAEGGRPPSSEREPTAGLASPAGQQGARSGERGTPESES